MRPPVFIPGRGWVPRVALTGRLADANVIPSPLPTRVRVETWIERQGPPAAVFDTRLPRAERRRLYGEWADEQTRIRARAFPQLRS